MLFWNLNPAGTSHTVPGFYLHFANCSIKGWNWADITRGESGELNQLYFPVAYPTDTVCIVFWNSTAVYSYCTDKGS